MLLITKKNGATEDKGFIIWKVQNKSMTKEDLCWIYLSPHRYGIRDFGSHWTKKHLLLSEYTVTPVIKFPSIIIKDDCNRKELTNKLKIFIE